MVDGGAVCHADRHAIYLDPKHASSRGINFVSHAHMDHLPTRNGGTILSSSETRMIARLRGFKMEKHMEGIGGAVMVDSGHILGSKGLWAEDIFYTGDICTRDRGFIKGASVPKCKILVTECTFGLPEFVFPSVRDTVSRVNRMISDLYSRGVPVVLAGYPLGKAQTLTDLFGHWEPLYCHDDVKVINDLHRELGVPLRDAMGHTEAERQGLLDAGPWVMIAPFLPEGSAFMQRMKARFGAVIVGFSGWASPSKFAFGRRYDVSVPLSDHCDFNELVQLAVDSQAEKIYTVHGFVGEFSASLRRLGFDAQPLIASSLDDFT